jgi:putative efflux ABC transporter, permease protein
VGVIGGLLGGLLALPLGRIYLLTWGEFNLFPRDLPLSMPVFCVPATVLVTALFSVLGGLGAARRAANVPEMQALREAAAPATRTKPWQWVAAVILLISAASLPILVNLPADVLEEDGTSKAEIAQMQSPGGRAIMGGAVGFMVALAALFIPNWTLRPLLTWWTSLIPGRSPAWFSARANARHRSALSMTTIVPFAIAVSMTGTIHAMGGAARSSGMSNGVSGFLTIMVPIFFVAGVGGVANIAMVGRTRRQEGALLGVIGARPNTILRSTALEGAIYAGTGILFGLATTLLSAVCAATMSGGGVDMFASAIPMNFLLAAIGASLVLAVATTWLPARLDRRALMDNLRQPT